MSVNKYEEFSQEVFINSESNFKSSAGDQVNKFKVNFQQSPFYSEDEAVLRVSLTQFNLNKTFYDVNASNNTVRVAVAAAAPGGGNTFTCSQFDGPIAIRPSDYYSINNVATEFGLKLASSLQSLMDTDTTVSVTQTDFQFTFGSDEDPNTREGLALPASAGGAPSENKVALQLTLAGANASVPSWTNLNVKIQCLSIPQINGVVPTSAGGAAGTSFTNIQQYNDSYALLGGIRIETVQDTPLSANADALQSFSFVIDPADDKIAYIVAYYPAMLGANTMPNVYLRMETADNQASSSTETAVHTHDNEMIPSRIIAKIPRQINNYGEISYRLDHEVPFFTNLTDNFINSMIFRLTDHKGRDIQPAKSDERPLNIAANQYTIPNLPTTQNTNGNLYVDMSFKVTKYLRKDVSKTLSTVPPPIIEPNSRIQFSGVIPVSAIDTF